MPTKGEKLFKRAQQTKAGWSGSELLSLYEAFEFQVRQGQGSHRVVSHPKYPELRAVVPLHQELAKSYVATAVKLIEALLALETGKEDSE